MEAAQVHVNQENIRACAGTEDSHYILEVDRRLERFCACSLPTCLFLVSECLSRQSEIFRVVLKSLSLRLAILEGSVSCHQGVEGVSSNQY